MAVEKLKVTISKAITNLDAFRTIERLFMKDKAISGPIEARSSNFKAKPKRRGGRIWTKRPNKVHPLLNVGTTATILGTAQFKKDLKSVERFVTVSAA
jgi:hypothetical protein